MPHQEQGPYLDPLWTKVEEAATRGDMPGVLFLLKALADKGVWQAYARIGEMYERGAPGVGKDAEQATHWYRRAVFEGDDPVAHVGLGRAHYAGIGGGPDYASARAHFEKAAAAGIPDAAIYLGMMHYAGLGVQRDPKHAEKHFAMAAEAEYFFAYFKLARIAFDEGKYLKGIWLCLKGWIIGFKVSRKDPHDPRLVGLDSASRR